MTQARYPVLVPFGNLVVATAGTTIPLSQNCGPLAGQVGNPQDYNHPPVPGTPLRQIILVNTGSNGVVLLPRGKTFSANPDSVIAYLPPNVPVALPQGQPFENGILPENFVLDLTTAGSCTVYGCGILS